MKQKANISEAELDKLWVVYKKNNDLETRNKLIVHFMPLVKYIASRMSLNMPPNIEKEDLEGYGINGLIDALEKYNPERKIKFKTYASMRIRGAILDQLRNLDWIPRSVRQKAHDVNRAYSKLEYKYGRAVEDHEVAKELGISEEEFSKILLEISGTNIISIDGAYNIGNEDDEISFHETLESELSSNPDVIVERKSLKELLFKSLKKLPERERLVLTLYYYEDLTLKEIGKVLDVTESRISQLHSKAIIRLRTYLKNNKEYFLNTGV